MPDEVARIFYQIRNWDHPQLGYENNRTREKVGVLDWFKTRIQLGTEELNYLLGLPDGPSLYGAWCLLLQMAARCRPRGKFLRFDGAPHSIESMAQNCGITAGLCKSAIEAVLKIGWLESKSFTRHAYTDGTRVRDERRTSDEATAETVRKSAASRATRGVELSRETLTPPQPPSPNGKGGHERRLTRDERRRAELAKDIERNLKA